MSNIKITDSVIYILWAWQGVMLNDLIVDNDDTLVIHLSIPSTSFVSNGTYDQLFPKVEKISQTVATAMRFNQGVKTKFVYEKREDHWTEEEARNAVKEMTFRVFLGNPFEGVM